MLRIWLTLIAVLTAMCMAAWATDFVTLQGERTIYSVTCEGGAWQGKVCSGKLVPAERYRFRSLRAHEEVLFWVVGASGPSHKYSGCKVKDGRNWSCPPAPDAVQTITREMKQGEPVADAATPTRAYHAVPKWRWLLLQCGVPLGQAAD